METLSFKSIAEVANESVKYIKDRKEHNIVPLKTGWNKFNKVCCGGIEPNMIFTIAGTSGSGKSAFVNILENNLIDLNPDQEIVILNFSFEIGYCLYSISYTIIETLSNRIRFQK